MATGNDGKNQESNLLQIAAQTIRRLKKVNANVFAHQISRVVRSVDLHVIYLVTGRVIIFSLFTVVSIGSGSNGDYRRVEGH